MDKKILRRNILSKRAALGKDGNISLSKKIINKLIDTEYYKNANTIMCYISFGSEINTHEFIRNCIKDGKRIVVPVTFHEPREMKPSQILSFDELEPGYFNILTPKKEFIRYIDPKEIDLIIVPGAVFDRKGYRIGFGGGYYDRFLADKINDKSTKISVAFHLQIIDQVPKEEHDVPVDIIITEKEIINCK
ncbi:5-formyltetrahydrofolate cyclo-ligase [Tissierella sp. Yu-01]|uniref:5-formyltetrahydrofolate cyclo-ligase n=1 Tax=Tissierella sp. Yu-01 TaxID=3035694 RepID=UPI00240D8343|nr:5-formyltetrahydrofolate cyclo-ligase [Tissierella sp. Yu-01]WFA09141.1 5-formyltetrahydrofolate cyclo-ligase [Tissierella sp. Yu-01]